jgi:hypothetical protein
MPGKIRVSSSAARFAGGAMLVRPIANDDLFRAGAAEQFGLTRDNEERATVAAFVRVTRFHFPPVRTDNG